MFIVFEGIDGSGKSTQARLLAEHLEEERGLDVLLLREPGGTELGEKLRALLLDPDGEDLAPETEVFLFMAARSHLVRTRILPALGEGRVVICDRFIWSTAVYQGLAAGLPHAEILRMGRLAAPGLAATRTFLIDVPAETAFRRVKEPNRMEGRGLSFQRRVRRGFLALAGKHPRRAAVIDGTGSPSAVHSRILSSLPSQGWSRCSSR
jgi:dTMP kinase